MTVGDAAGVGLDWILGRCDSLRAEVFVRAALPAGVDPASATLAGTLAGPECRRAITLPVTARLSPVAGPDAAAAAHSVVARAILTEPSFWTPEVPSLYRLDARLVAGGRELSRWTRPAGLRRLGIRGRSLWLDGRRFVPRGVVGPAAAVVADSYREAALAAVVADPTEELLERCDREGIALVALLADSAGAPLDPSLAADRVARWAWHPAVLGAVVPRAVSAERAAAIAEATRRARGTLLLAREVDGTRPPSTPAAGLDAIVVALPAGGLPHPAWRAAPPLPLIARRPDDAAGSEPSRRGCDTLQAALAAWGTAGGGSFDWAGYVVG